jgi:hypothetical protein
LSPIRLLAIASLFLFTACSSSGGTPTPGTGGSAGGTTGAGGADSPGTGGTGDTGGTTGAAGSAGATGAGGAAGTVAGAGGATGSAGSGGAAGTGGAGTGRGGASGSGGSAGSGGGAGGASADPCATALFCDDFESYTVGQAPTGNWTRSVSSGSTAAVDSAQFRSGSKSVKFVAASGSGSKNAYIRLGNATGKTIFPVTPNAIYGRMMFRLESAPSASVHWTFLQGSGLISGQNYHALYRYGGQLPVMNGSTFVGNQFMANYETPDSYGGTGPSSDCYKHANKIVVPTGAWSCAEWQFDGPTNTMRFWLDGAAVDSLTVMNTGSGCVNQPATYTWTAPTFDRLDLGWESYQQDSARTIWIDDVVVSKTRVGCPAP